MSLKVRKAARRRRPKFREAAPDLSPALKEIVRPLLRKRLALAGLKGGAFSVWIIMLVFDIIWRVFVSPFIKRERRQLEAKRRVIRIKKAASDIKEAKTASELVAAHKAFYARKDQR